MIFGRGYFRSFLFVIATYFIILGSLCAGIANADDDPFDFKIGWANAEETKQIVGMDALSYFKHLAMGGNGSPFYPVDAKIAALNPSEKATLLEFVKTHPDKALPGAWLGTQASTQHLEVITQWIVHGNLTSDSAIQKALTYYPYWKDHPEWLPLLHKEHAARLWELNSTLDPMGYFKALSDGKKVYPNPRLSEEISKLAPEAKTELVRFVKDHPTAAVIEGWIRLPASTSYPDLMKEFITHSDSATGAVIAESGFGLAHWGPSPENLELLKLLIEKQKDATSGGPDAKMAIIEKVLPSIHWLHHPEPLLSFLDHFPGYSDELVLKVLKEPGWGKNDPTALLSIIKKGNLNERLLSVWAEHPELASPRAIELLIRAGPGDHPNWRQYNYPYMMDKLLSAPQWRQNSELIAVSPTGKVDYQTLALAFARGATLHPGWENDGVRYYNSDPSRTVVVNGAEAAKVFGDHKALNESTTNPASVKPSRVSEDPLKGLDGKFVKVDSSGATPSHSAPKPLGEGASVEVQYAQESLVGSFQKGVRVITDEVSAAVAKGISVDIIGRDKEAQRVIDVLARLKGKAPVLTGNPGVGKTTIMERLAQLIVTKQLPEGKAYDKFRNAVVVEASASSFTKSGRDMTEESIAKATEEFINDLRESEKKLGRPIILYVDEVHQLSPHVWDTLKTSLEGEKGILFVGATTSRELNQLETRDPAIQRRLQRVLVNEFSEEETIAVLKKTLVPKLEREYGGRNHPSKITDDAIVTAVKRYKLFLPQVARPDGPGKLLQDAMIRAHRLAGDQPATLTAKGVGAFLVDELKLPVDPSANEKEYSQQIQNLRARLNAAIVGQPHLVDAYVDSYRDIFSGVDKNRLHRVILSDGITGSGKSFSGRTFARQVLGSQDRFLEIDCTAYKTKEDLWTLFGARNGYVSSNITKGVLPEFLSGPGSGWNVIQFNEIDKSSPEFFEAIMEILDTGAVTGGDGRVYPLGNSIISLTGNRASQMILPSDLKQKFTQEEKQRRMKTVNAQRIKDEYTKPQAGRSPITDAFFERVDHVVPIFPPSLEEAFIIAQAEARKAEEDLYGEKGYRIKIDDSVLHHIVDQVYLPEKGVRKTKAEVVRLIQKAKAEVVNKLQSEPQTGDTFAISYTPPPRGSLPAYSVIRESDHATFDLAGVSPERVKIDPYRDPEVRERIANIESTLEKRVIGQPKAIASVAQSLRALTVDSSSSKGASFLFLGASGVGKTEIAKVIAEKIYDNPDKLFVEQMGDYKSLGDLGKLFGENGGSIRRFESFIKNNPDGGVLLWDETSNMGGGHPGVKHEMLKTFYPIVQEGKWTSPVTGEVYDLSKFINIFTGNDGIGATSPKHLKELLTAAGWPTPLIGRFSGNIIGFDKLNVESRAKIAALKFDTIIKALKDRHGVTEVTIDPDFFSIAASTFNTKEEGARSLEVLTDIAVKDLIADALLGANRVPEGLEGSKIHLKLSDNYSGKLFYPDKRPPERKVVLFMDLETKTGKHRFDRDLTDRVSEKELMSEMSHFQMSIHEAGHAIANEPNLTGREVKRLYFVNDLGEIDPFTEYSVIGVHHFATRENIVNQIAAALGGREAERAYGISENIGWRGDAEKATSMAHNAIERGGLAKNTLSLPRNGDGSVDMTSTDAQAEVRALLEEGRNLAAERVRRNRTALELVAGQLYREHSVNKTTFLALVEKAQVLDGKKQVELGRLLPLGAQKCFRLVQKLAEQSE